MTRPIDYIIIHCTRTPPGDHLDRKDIDRKHRLEQRLQIGYHYVIKRCGTLQVGRKTGEPGRHCKGYDKNSIAICLVGGADQDGQPCDNFTNSQIATAKDLISQLLMLYPSAVVAGHAELEPLRNGEPSGCPAIDVRKLL